MQITDEVVSLAIDAARKHAREVMGVACEIEPETMRAALDAALGARSNRALPTLRCIVTGHIVGTDTRMVGKPCECPTCIAAACIEDLAAALKNFAMIEMPSQEPDHWPIFGKNAGMGWPIVGDFRVARAVIERWGLK